MKSLLITGASGFIGQALIKRLGEYYNTITPSGKEMDIRDEKQVERVLKREQPNFIIHLAARTEVESSFYEQKTFAEINYVGTVNLAETARRVVKDLELFVFSSTMETYGWQPKDNWEPFDENTSQNPNAPYAVAKLAGEKYLMYLGRAYNFPYTILRQTNTYGREDNDFFVVEQVITQMLKNPKEINLGYREPYRNFLYIDDLVNLYEKVLHNVDLSKNEVFCTGPPNAIQISELVEVIADHVGWEGIINWGTKLPRPGEIYYLNSSGDKAKRVLNWSPQLGLREGLERTVALWRNKLNLT